MNNERKVYIYNPLQAQFYMNNGIVCLDTGIHNKTHRTFWVFDYDETKDVYTEWVLRKH